MGKSIKGTKTEQNLLKAFAGESQARTRYTFFASVAKKEGFEQIAGVFLETADQEKEHAKRFFKFLEGGMVEITASYPLPRRSASSRKSRPSMRPGTGLCSHASRRTRCSSATRRSNGSAATAGMCTRARTRPRCARRAAIPRPFSSRRRTTTKRGGAFDRRLCRGRRAEERSSAFFRRVGALRGGISDTSRERRAGKACGRSRSILGLRTVCIAWGTGPCAA